MPIGSFILCLILSFAATLLLCKRIIPILMQKKLGQRILEIGPRWHKNKEGTPTMGGVCFLFPILGVGVLALLLISKRTVKGELIGGLLTLIFALANALIGMIDDLTKFKKNQNQGLTPRQKLVLQTSVATAYLALLDLFLQVPTTVRIPFTEQTIQLGVLFYPLALLFLVGLVNCANLTDGLDGLATSVAAILSGFFALVATVLLSETVLLFSGALLGGTLAFLIFNYHPARVFMGDTGSLFLGAMLAGLSLLLGDVGFIALGGALYLLEGLSVILQVLYFKLTHGKRLFLMAPLHHHFERLGWSEVKVVSVFSMFSFFTCLVAFFAYL
jgi:phospho-N-acetylmuramoyl-pentapeptide-transferase